MVTPSGQAATPVDPSTGVVIDLSGLRLESHVRQALRQAVAASNGAPFSAAALLKAAISRGGSKAFWELARILPWHGEPRVGAAQTPSEIDMSTINVEPALARSFAVAESFFAETDDVVWGRDLVTVALLVRDDLSLVEMATQARTDIDRVRAEWFEFVQTSSSSHDHRPPEQWDRWWRAAGFGPSEGPSRVELPLSRTVQGVQDDLRGRDSEELTSFDIATAVIRRHPEYAERRMRWDQLGAPAEARRLTWNSWLGSVSEILDLEALGSSPHKVLDGRLLLVTLGLVDRDLRHRLEELGWWGPLLLEIDDAAAPPGSVLATALRSVQLRHGYSNDSVGGDDQLRIQGEVNALCEVLLDPKVSPPVAVGLFGEWGSGKSFFMERMRQRVHKLAPQKGYGDDEVVQINFNAWHYADTSLWASLAVEIFERLADPEPPSPEDRRQWILRRGDPKEEERRKLLSELESYKSARAALDAQLMRLAEERTAVNDRLEAAVERRRIERSRSAQLTDVATALAKDPKVADSLEQVSTALGFRPSVVELTSLASELRTTAGYLPAVWRSITSKTMVIGLSAAFIVLALATVGLVARPGSDQIVPALGALATALASVASATTAAAKYVQPAALTVNATWAAVENAVRTAAEVEAELRAKRAREETELAARLEDLDREIADAERSIAALDEQIATTRAQADALSVGRQLYDFLADRAAGYQRHQGVVGMLHRDFRLLNARMSAYQVADDRWPDLPVRKRVILYIDDLDRCPPPKVLEVLEAVHLLLALEMFVVVVGVDPRWLRRSLRYQYRDLVLGGDPDDDVYLRVMPLEYLEKIFQIPFTLPAMEPAAYGQLIASLAPAARPREPQAETHFSHTRRSVAPDGPSVGRAPTRAPLDVQRGSSASGADKGGLDLTTPEVKFAQSLGPLLDTPRAAKRLMNTYRLIRATQHVRSRSRFLGIGGQPGEYQAVLTLLAVAAGYPGIADPFLVALEEDAVAEGVSTWSDFLEAIDPSAPGPLVPATLGSPATGTAPSLESTAWSDLHRGLASAQPQNALGDLEPYQRWGRIAARFSFTL